MVARCRESFDVVLSFRLNMTGLPQAELAQIVGIELQAVNIWLETGYPAITKRAKVEMAIIY